MSRNRFVTDKLTKKYFLKEPDGSQSDDWIELKERLTYGERMKLNGAGLSGVQGKVEGNNLVLDNESVNLGFDTEKMAIEVMATWIADWSFVNDKGKQLPVSRENIRHLDEDTAEQVMQIIDAHNAEVQERKNSVTG